VFGEPGADGLAVERRIAPWTPEVGQRVSQELVTISRGNWASSSNKKKKVGWGEEIFQAFLTREIGQVQEPFRIDGEKGLTPEGGLKKTPK